MQQQKITGRDNGQGQARVETRLSAVAGARDHAHALATVNLEPVSDLVAAQLACRAANCAASDLESRFPTKLHQPLWMLPLRQPGGHFCMESCRPRFPRAGNIVVQSCPHLGHHSLASDPLPRLFWHSCRIPRGLGDVVGQVPLTVAIDCVV